MVRQHRLGAVDGLFAWLADQHQRPMPLALERGHVARYANHGGDVHIVSARVHHADILPCGVLRPYFARIRQVRVFDHRQRVEVCPDEQRRTGAVLQNPHHTISL